MVLVRFPKGVAVSDSLKEAVNYVKEHRYQPTAALVLFFLFFISTILLLAQIPLGAIPWWSWLTALAVSVTAVLLWWLSVKPKRHPKRVVGVDIAIVSEEPKQQLQVRNDFVATIRKLMESSSRSSHPFHLIEHPKHIAAKIKSREDAMELTRKTRGRFLVYGTTKLRDIQGKRQHVLELEGLVRHKPIGQEVSQRFSGEFREVLPPTFIISPTSDLLSFRVTAEWIDIAARYIVGVASGFSGDLDYAESLFLDLERRLHSSSSLPSPMAKIKHLLPVRLAEVYKVRSGKLYDDYWIKQDNQILKEMELWNQKALKYDPNWYSGHLAQAICAFVLRRDLSAAWESIGKCKKIPETTWRYSAAFLHAYEGDLKKAYQEYKRAFYDPPQNQTVPIQSEDFIHLVLEEEPEKGQLYYCLGLINLRAKRDLVAAKNDFQQFLNSEAADHFPEEQKIVRIQIGEIQRQLKEEVGG